MITEFPNCTYEGCDIVDLTNKKITPKQFNWKYGNFLERLDYPDNTFDFIHMRLLILSVREVDWPIVLKEALRVLKPGGVIQWKEFDLKVRNLYNFIVSVITYLPPKIIIIDDW